MSDNTAAAREQCHALFNNAAFADVVMAADEAMTGAVDGTVTTRQIAAALGLSDSVVRPVMVRLLAAELLDELPKVGPANGPRLFHRRNESRWKALCALIVDVAPAQRRTRRGTARRS